MHKDDVIGAFVHELSFILDFIWAGLFKWYQSGGPARCIGFRGYISPQIVLNLNVNWIVIIDLTRSSRIQVGSILISSPSSKNVGCNVPN